MGPTGMNPGMGPNAMNTFGMNTMNINSGMNPSMNPGMNLGINPPINSMGMVMN